MSFKTIQVYVDASASSPERIAVAARMAIQEDAHLIGTAVTGLSPYTLPFGAFDQGMPAIQFPIEQLRQDADQALDAFEAQVRRLGVNSFERRRLDEEAGFGISMQARYADLVVISQFDRSSRPPLLRSDFPEYVLLNCARPVLVVPIGAHDVELGKSIVVGWNGSTNATRALTSAIPLMQRAHQIRVMVFNADVDADAHGDLPGADIGLYLARHAIRVEVISRHTGADPGAALLAHASDVGADLIVMGAYGHARLREVLLGGATRTVLRSSPLPLWMAH